MKRILAMLLCTLLALMLFTACGGGAQEEPSTTEEVTEAADASAVASTTESTTEDATATTNDGTTASEDASAEDATTAAGDADPFAPPANLNTLSKAEQLEYFNLAANRVREEKPGFKKESLLKLGKISLTGIASIANPIIEPVKNNLMPGTPTYETVNKGQESKGKFFSDNANASDLRASDLTSISSTKNGNNWVIKVSVIAENNPAKGTASANARINTILSPAEVLQEITNISDAIKADVNKATLRYHSAYAQITVNAEGQVIAAQSGFQVDAKANDVKIGPITTDVTAPQTSTFKWTGFTW